jgi:hypothetical protein
LSEIRANTISDAAGTGPVTLTKQSAAKAICAVYHTAGVPYISHSTNTSSITDYNVGEFVVNLTNSFSGAYAGTAGGWAYSTWVGAETGIGNMQPSNFRVGHKENNAGVDTTAGNTYPLSGVAYGDLA